MMYKIYYGTLENKVDITEKVTNGIIPAGDAARNNLYGDHLFGTIKFIFIEHPDSTLSSFNHQVKITIKDSVITTEPAIIIVYYIYINLNKDWKAIVSGQLEDLVTIQFNSQMHIHICSEEPKYIDECKYLINGIIKKEITFYSSTENNYEYPGIKLLYDLAQKNKESIFFYMHTKGMVRSESHTRSIEEQRLFRSTVYHHNTIQDIFKNNQQVNKIGLMPSQNGQIWYNFYWVRASYLTVQPEISSNRFYYEQYISLSCENYLDCYSLLAKNICFYTNVTADTNVFTNGTFTEINDYFDKKSLVIEYGTLDNKVDITEKVYSNCLSGKNIFISSGDVFRSFLFGDHLFGTIKSIFIKNKEYKHYTKIFIKNYKDIYQIDEIPEDLMELDYIN